MPSTLALPTFALLGHLSFRQFPFWKTSPSRAFKLMWYLPFWNCRWYFIFLMDNKPNFFKRPRLLAKATGMAPNLRQFLLFFLLEIIKKFYKPVHRHWVLVRSLTGILKVLHARKENNNNINNINKNVANNRPTTPATQQHQHYNDDNEHTNNQNGNKLGYCCVYIIIVEHTNTKADQTPRNSNI